MRIARHLVLMQVALWFVLLCPVGGIAQAVEQAQKTGVSLSGGGALSLAHIGVLEALDSAGVKIDCITGCSFGSLVAVLYAEGYSPDDIYRIFKKEKVHRIVSLYRPNCKITSGVVSNKHLKRKLAKYLPHNSFDSLKIKFYCSVTDMDSNCVRYVGSGGHLVEYVIASLSLPGLFPPVKIDDVYYLDGGSQDMMPWKPLVEENCTRRIGAYPILCKPQKVTTTRFLWTRAYNNIFYQTILRGSSQFNELIAIDPGTYGVLSFKRMAELRQYGFSQTLEALKAYEESRKNLSPGAEPAAKDRASEAPTCATAREADAD